MSVERNIMGQISDLRPMRRAFRRWYIHRVTVIRVCRHYTHHSRGSVSATIRGVRGSDKQPFFMPL